MGLLWNKSACALIFLTCLTAYVVEDQDIRFYAFTFIALAYVCIQWSKYFVSFCCNCCCCLRCCQRRLPKFCRRWQRWADSEIKTSKRGPSDQTSVKVGDAEVLVQHLRKKKNIGVAYVLWLFTGFWGGHLYYLDRIAHGLAATWSLNFVFLGWIVDFYMIPCYLCRYNNKTSDKLPGRDLHKEVWQCCRLAGGVPLMFVLALCCFFFIPQQFQNFGILDLEKSMAKTQTNPYDLLHVQHNASLQEARKAYKKELNRLPDEDECDEECKSMKIELEKAFEFVSGEWRFMADDDEPPKNKTRRHSRRRKKSREEDDWVDEMIDRTAWEWEVLVGHLLHSLAGFAGDPA